MPLPPPVAELHQKIVVAVVDHCHHWMSQRRPMKVVTSDELHPRKSVAFILVDLWRLACRRLFRALEDEPPVEASTAPQEEDSRTSKDAAPTAALLSQSDASNAPQEEDSSTSTDAAPIAALLSQSDASYAGIRTRSQTKSMKRDASPGSSSKTAKRKRAR